MSENKTNRDSLFGRASGATGKHNGHYVNRDFYFYYNRNTKIKNRLKRDPYSRFLADLKEELIKAMIFENLIIEIPFVGKLYIHGKKIEKNSMGTVDWYESKKYWKQKYPDKTDREIIELNDKKYVHYDNFHTDGYLYRIRLKFNDGVPGRKYYYFIPNLVLKRRFAKELKDPKNSLIFYEEIYFKRSKNFDIT